MKILTLAFFVLAAVCTQGYGEEKMINMIPKSHPRIILTDERLAELKELLKTDKDLQELAANLEKVGDCIIAQPPLERKLVGVKRFRLLSVSRQALSRCLVLGTLYRLDGKAKWRERLTKELKAVCSFEDWYPKHFLDTAEMSAAVALGYDWVCNDLSDEDREFIRDRLIKLGVEPGAKVDGWWVRGHNNWNQVCHCGMTLAAIAVAHDAPEKCEALLQSAKKNYVTGMAAYAPAGIYPEGPGYWNYGTAFSVVMASAVDSVLGTDWGMLDIPGFVESFTYRMHVQGPTGRVVNYADGGDGCESSPYHFYMAKKTGRSDFASFAMETIEKDYAYIRNEKYATSVDSKINRLLALAVAWYVPADDGQEQPLDWFATADGQVNLALMRSAWGDENALFCSLKAGILTASHGHLDAGTFIIESDGVRWANEFGSEKEIYDRNDSWSMKQDSHRWAYFRVNNHGHNTLTIDGEIHRVEGIAPIIATSSGDSPYAIADLSAAFKGQAASVKRGIMMPERKQFLVQDEIAGVEKGKNIRWNMIMKNDAKVSEDGRAAVLEVEGKQLNAKLLSPVGAKFSVIDAAGKREDENKNEGYKRLIIDVLSDGKPITIAVEFDPGMPTALKKDLVPLAEWTPSI